MSTRPSDLEYLVELTEGTVPKFFIELTSDDQHLLREYVETIVKRDESGLDKLFESMPMMMKILYLYKYNSTVAIQNIKSSAN